MKVVNSYGALVDFDCAVDLMDDEICNEVHDEFAPCTEQEFFDRYCDLHYKCFLQDFELDKMNPVY